MNFYIEGPDGGINFQVDSLSLIEEQVADDIILIDGGFEKSLRSSPWICLGDCNGERVDDSQSGEKSYKVSAR